MIKWLKKINLIYLFITLVLLINNNNFAQMTYEPTASQQQTTALSPTEKPINELSDIYLNFENANLLSVVNYLCEEKKINIVPNKNLENIKVSLNTKETLTLTKAWNILLTLLEINGYTIINVDNLYRIVPKAQNKQEPLPIYSGVDPETLPETDEVVRFIYFLKNIKAETVDGFLKNMLEGNIQINSSLNALIITERALFIKSAMKIITELDLGGLRESIKILKLKHSIAEDIAKLFKEIIPNKDQQKDLRFLLSQPDKAQATFFSQDTQIIPEPRRNALILLGLEKNLNKIIDFIQKYVDIPMDEAKSRLHIKELKYAKAENIKPILQNIIKPPAGFNKSMQVGEYKFFEDILIALDSSKDEGGGNRLIISCGKEDWKRLEKLIDNIDKPQPQIAFEVMVIDVTADNKDELWAQFKPKKLGALGKNVDPQFNTALDVLPTTLAANRIDLKYDQQDSTNQTRTGQSATNMTFGRTNNLWGMLQAVLEKTNYNVIIQPYITTNNNQPCEINFILERQVDAAISSKTATGQLLREKSQKQAPTAVKLTPKVNLNGTIDLKISVDIEEFITTTQTDPSSIVRRLDTKINVGTGEVIVLGGLTKSTHTENVYKVPLLGDIPIVGNLFKGKSLSKEKQNLYIFIRPSIIKPKFEGVPDEYTQLKLDFAKHQILQYDTYTQDKDPIQRWFFKPEKQSIKQKISDAKLGIFRPIDNYSSGFNQPKEVNIKYDSYYRIAQEKEKAALWAKNLETQKASQIIYASDTNNEPEKISIENLKPIEKPRENPEDLRNKKHKKGSIIKKEKIKKVKNKKIKQEVLQEPKIELEDIQDNNMQEDPLINTLQKDITKNKHTATKRSRLNE
ncbi:MAG: General secretion pathway protein D [candidate division TM6 bacterium GW2011_GWF2_28_16]|nr:MAG: General secretion pathway protein D [candidate division TM6 bacterium GW2011_GWF2_28_16]